MCVDFDKRASSGDGPLEKRPPHNEPSFVAISQFYGERLVTRVTSLARGLPISGGVIREWSR
jgi:hypothetical protein